ncbi:MAG: radical SAM family heme chaperone HemW [Chloroflexi bacterium]|nr:radical SAM family heme chaperone HemW [Chloroflexota bacterium]
MRGLYVHVPFCARKCSYCDFYSLPARLDLLEAYVQAVVHESHRYGGLSFQTLYLGGGTPSLLGPGHLRELVGGIGKSVDLSELIESTIEVNPESATGALLEAAREAGINRVSIGVQSLSDYELQGVGRIHTAAQAVEAIILASRLGFKSVSADLIIGLPGQTWSALHRTLGTLVGAGIEHVSLYCLSLEKGTPLEKSPPLDLPSDDTQAQLFEQARSFLLGHGFIHYEISNFALKGYECLHNLNYWRGGEYVGLGPAAASHLYGRRFRNRADLDAYIDRPGYLTEDVEELDVRDKASEEAMLRLRLLVEGLDAGELAAKFGRDNIEPLADRLERMAHDGLLVFDGLRYRLAPSRVLTSNPIFAEVL